MAAIVNCEQLLRQGPEVRAGQECGMAFENYQDIRAGDIIECYRVEEIERTLD